MSRLAMNKATLSKQRKQLAQYVKFLPSLDLKRRQLQMEVNKAEREVAVLRERDGRFYQALARYVADPKWLKEAFGLETNTPFDPTDGKGKKKKRRQQQLPRRRLPRLPTRPLA